MKLGESVSGEIALDLARAPDVRQFIDQLLRRIAEALEAPRATLSRIEGDWVIIEGSYDAGGVAAEPGQRWPITSSEFGRILESREPTVQVYDLATLPPPFLQQLAGVHHTVTVPLILEGEILGTIAVSRREDRRFTETDLSTLRGLGSVAVLALRSRMLLAAASAAATQLKRSEERFRLLVESVQDYAIFMLDPAGCVTSWNLGAERIKGYRADEIIGRSFATFYPPEDVEDGKPARGLAIAERDGHYQAEGWRVRKDGSRFWASVVITALRNERGVLRGFAKITRDMTRAHEERERMAVLERMKSEFLNLASHELRTPVSLFLGYLSMFEEGDMGKLNLRGRQAVAILQSQARELKSLVEQLLEAARMQDRSIALHREDIDLRQLTGNAVDWARSLASATHHIIEYLPDGPVMVRGDRRRLTTVLHNLLENAVKYSPSGGEIGCEVEADGGQARVTVRDHGLGLDAGQLGQLFRPFGRIVTNETADISGAGLGLYLAQELARLHGGNITVDPDARRGSAFVLRLPMVSSEQVGRDPVPAMLSATQLP